MRIVAIGDVHGRTVWRRIVDKYDIKETHFIFLGDYVDPYRSELVNDDECFENFEDIIHFKNKYPDNVTLLLGNHDV